MTAVIDSGDVSRLRALCRREVPSYPLGLVRAADVNALVNGIWQELNEIEARRAKGGDVLQVKARGNSVPEIHADALAKAPGLWGAAAKCEVEETGTVQATDRPGFPAFLATVYVRCLNYAEIAP